MNKKLRILITGCGGMLGSAVYKTFSDHFTQILATDIDLNEKWLSYLDVRDIHACQKIFSKFKPDIILHLAALTDLEYCEEHPDDAWKTNALGTENIALLSQKSKTTMIYITSAGAFDGTKKFYNDFDLPNPINFYASSKYYGELFVQNHVDKYFIFRAGWMMGGGKTKDKKFINKIYKQISAGNKELWVVDDKFGTPTYTVDLANSIIKITDSGFYGLYNQVCSGICSRYDIACEFVRLLGLKDKIKIHKVKSDHFKDSFFAQRPESECLVNLKATSRGINFMRDWKTCLKEYVKEFK